MSRTLANMLGVLGAGMVGYQRGKDQKAEGDRRDEEADYNRRQRERTEREQKRQDEIRTSMTEAYAPTTVQAEPPKPDTMDNADVGQPGEQPVGGFVAGGRMVDGYREGGQRFATQAEADKFAADYNAPAARTARMSDVLASNGEPVAAQNLRTSARQERLSEMQLSDAERAHVEKMFDDGLVGLQTPDQVADYVSKSSIGGSLQLKAVPSADGQTFTFVKVNADGSTAPASNPFPNTPQGLMEAKVGMSKAIPLSQKLDHIYKAAQLKIAQQNADTDAAYKEAMGDAAGVRAAKPGANTFDRMSEVDRLQFNSLNKRQTEIESEITKARAQGMWQDDSDNARQLKTELATIRLQATQLLRKYSTEQAPDPLGMRGGGQGAAPAATSTRPMTSMEKVLADMKKTGVKDAQVNVDGNSVRIGQGGAPAPVPAAAPAAAPVPFDPNIEAKAQREMAEMGNATRRQFSPDVAAYLQQKKDAEQAALAEQNAKRSATMAAQENARRKQLGY